MAKCDIKKKKQSLDSGGWQRGKFENSVAESKQSLTIQMAEAKFDR